MEGRTISKGEIIENCNTKSLFAIEDNEFEVTLYIKGIVFMFNRIKKFL